MQFAPRSGYAVDTGDAFVLTQLGATETLVGTSPDRTAAPRLATAWTRTDPLTRRFALRPDVSFQDGTPLTAQAVAGSLNWVAASSAPPRAVKGIGLSAKPDRDGTVLVVLLGRALERRWMDRVIAR